MANERDDKKGDVGPWVVRRDEVRQWRICSENFKHDVELIITGDFKDEAETVEYAADIARRLSAPQSAVARSEMIERSADSIERIYNEAHVVAMSETQGEAHDSHVTALIHVYAAGKREALRSATLARFDGPHLASTLRKIAHHCHDAGLDEDGHKLEDIADEREKAWERAATDRTTPTDG